MMTFAERLVARYFNPATLAVPSSTGTVCERLRRGGELTEVCPACDGRGHRDKRGCWRCAGRGAIATRAPAPSLQTQPCTHCQRRRPTPGKGVLFDDAAGLGASAGCERCEWRGYVTGLDAQPVHPVESPTAYELDLGRVDQLWAVGRWLRGLSAPQRAAVEACYAPRAVAWREAGGCPEAPLMPLAGLGRTARELDVAGSELADRVAEVAMGQCRRMWEGVRENVRQFGRELVAVTIEKK